ncbi:hypothetical protein HELRODRAFT_184571, partial [Helobdella robusta]|uniref:Uncharacterized protein n=1 Tax=Helobdella robusta TaxID=6412 RepID=T1FLI0_HELRO
HDPNNIKQPLPICLITEGGGPAADGVVRYTSVRDVNELESADYKQLNDSISSKTSGIDMDKKEASKDMIIISSDAHGPSKTAAPSDKSLKQPPSKTENSSTSKQTKEEIKDILRNHTTPSISLSPQQQQQLHSLPSSSSSSSQTRTTAITVLPNSRKSGSPQLRGDQFNRKNIIRATFHVKGNNKGSPPAVGGDVVGGNVAGEGSGFPEPAILSRANRVSFFDKLTSKFNRELVVLSCVRWCGVCGGGSGV